MRALADRVRLTVGIDSATGARQLVEHARGVGVLVEIDSEHRTGVLPEQAGAVASAAREAGLDVRGVFTFPGHSYAPDAPRSAAREEADALAAAAESLRAAGIEPSAISGGSSPLLFSKYPRSQPNCAPGCTSSATPSNSNSAR
ncbi:hypothetical protein NJ76_05120 [Rhodococcus sp. IITR03]|nr:hypothetical protein NJ76_05120 [Rhodococcus sp. IITR03]